MSHSGLSVIDRATIEVCLYQGLSLRAIARCLSRSSSTISREMRRNSGSGNDYRAVRTQALRLRRRRFCRPKRKLSIDSEQSKLSEYFLRHYLSTEQIAGKLRHMNLPKLEDAYVCRETIYTTIYALPVGQLRKELIHCLQQGKSTRKPRRGEIDRRGQITATVSIHLRTPEMDKHEMPGH